MDGIEIAALGLCGLSLLYWTATVLGILESHRRLGPLPPAGDASASTWPPVTVIVPACDEIGSIEVSLRALLASDYPQLEVIAVDDRSRDGTGAAMDAVAAADPRLQVIHVETLPDGWLGKVHAMHRGLERARGEWVLFTDADVRQAPDALRRALALATRERLDLLTAMPRMSRTRLLPDVATSVFARSILVGGQAWRSRDPRSRVATGLGAFVQVRREVLARAGGLEPIRLEVADDMALAALIKGQGGRCDVALANDAMDIALYPDWAALRGSMEKSGFAIIGRYSLLRTVALGALLPALEWGLILSPLVAFAPGLRWACAVCAAIALGACAAFEHRLGRPAWLGLLAPLGSLVLSLLVLRSGLLAWRRGGVRWRGVLYPTPQLRTGSRYTWP